MYSWVGIRCLWQGLGESFVYSDKYGWLTPDCERNWVWWVIGLDAYIPTGYRDTSVFELVVNPLVFFFRWWSIFAVKVVP